MTDREKLVKILVEADQEIGILCDGCGSRPEHEIFGNIADHLLSHGVTVQEPKKPIQKGYILENSPCWLEELSEKYGYSLDIADFTKSATENVYHASFIGFEEYEKYDVDQYGKTWRCWAEKPTEEERQAAEWEK